MRFLVLCDAAVLAVASVFAASLGTGGGAVGKGLWAGATVAVMLAAFSFEHLYERDRRQIAVSTLDEGREFASTLSFVCFAELALGQALGAHWAGSRTIALFWFSSLVALPTGRGLFRHLVVPHLNTPENTIVVGAGRVGQIVARKLRRHPEFNLRLIGFLDNDPHPLDSSLDDLRVLGTEDDLVATIRRYRISRVVLAFSKRTPDDVIELIRTAGLRDVHLSIVPRYFEIFTGNVQMADIDGIPVIDLPSARLSRLARASKRGFDLLAAAPSLILLTPLFAVIALAIKLESRGPVFFRQTRRGRDEQTFEILKFRTMVDGAERLRSTLLSANESTGPLFKIREDPRVTRVGRVLRRLSLDELPQLWNVFTGAMSLVGPRPFVVYEDEKINGWARRRLDLTPGITGPWQVLGRNEIGFDEMIRLDYLYVTNWSLWWDIKLLLRTVPIVLRRNGY